MKTKIMTILLPGLLAVSGCSTSPTEPVFDNPLDERGNKYQAITTISPSGGSVLNSRDVTLSWKGTPAVEKGYEYSFDGGALQQITQNSLSIDDLEEGLHTFLLKPVSVENDTTITFTVNAVPGPGVVFSPRKITSSTQNKISLILENVENLMGAHLEIIFDNRCVLFDSFTLSDDAVSEYQMISYITPENDSLLIIDMGCRKENGFSGSITLGSIKVTPLREGKIQLDSNKTIFRNMNNTDIEMNGFDFVRVVK